MTQKPESLFSADFFRNTNHNRAFCLYLPGMSVGERSELTNSPDIQRGCRTDVEHWDMKFTSEGKICKNNPHFCVQLHFEGSPAVCVLPFEIPPDSVST